ncbi:uncharacterized protein LOC143372860 [Andrena cerasifolii]|uniref:uncharacterized protein LOC143372860 n=1 Tax=Andrena cerasifolii TaxID=2819439 RepID=UPI0040379791
MLEFKRLKDAATSLGESVSNFPIGAVSLDDFKPIEERIRNTRETLKHLSARSLILKAQHEYQTTRDKPAGDAGTMVTSLHEATANFLINNEGIKLCLHSYAIQAILSGKEGDQEMKKKIYACMSKLFCLNDNILSLQKSIGEAREKQLDLKIQCQNSLYEYRNFFKEQEEMRSKKFDETHPEIARHKEKTNKTLETINMMKKLIINFTATFNHMLLQEPFFIEMLEGHRELVTIETILKMSRRNAEAENKN